MARPRKSRNVCHFPSSLSFAPTEAAADKPPIVLTVDEYETIRLIDQEGFSQEACGEQMGVARTTVQMIYASARKKLARMLVEGKSLQISGGDYRLCAGDQNCGQTCYKKQYSRQYGKSGKEQGLRIAVPYDNGYVYSHFEEALQFLVCDILNESIQNRKIITAKGTGYGAQAGVLTALQTDILICDRLSPEANMALTAAGIRLHCGITGDANAAIAGFLTGTVQKL